eukprot:CAMPEP_0175095312 /NCGR_PEP_ID=MMETSP0086_2-20121207/4081_1 /TAXON_ID=136419 /ORGANISM="Unknown Unknown, Strain D1" /LENGTH=77 /DNA_ID=CAMNT_0016368537 /DNA_START=73 /DNA_END=306 /DNA_ORIENTATION=-
MARGHMKLQAQAKNAEKQAALKKKQNKEGGLVNKALTNICTVCKASMPGKASATQLQSHVDKHKGKTVAECFPQFKA